jgi:hypothetical protein
LGCSKISLFGTCRRIRQSLGKKSNCALSTRSDVFEHGVQNDQNMIFKHGVTLEQSPALSTASVVPPLLIPRLAV